MIANPIRVAIHTERERESMLRRVVVWLVGGWVLCPGCGQSATSTYLSHHCCTRCQAVIT